MYFVFFLYLARKSEIIRSTELLLDAISSNDFESYAYVEFANSHIRVLHFRASLVGKVNVPNFQNLLLTENLNLCWVLQIIQKSLTFFWQCILQKNLHCKTYWKYRTLILLLHMYFSYVVLYVFNNAITK